MTDYQKALNELKDKNAEITEWANIEAACIEYTEGNKKISLFFEGEKLVAKEEKTLDK